MAMSALMRRKRNTPPQTPTKNRRNHAKGVLLANEEIVVPSIRESVMPIRVARGN